MKLPVMFHDPAQQDLHHLQSFISIQDQFTECAGVSSPAHPNTGKITDHHKLITHPSAETALLLNQDSCVTMMRNNSGYSQ